MDNHNFRENKRVITLLIGILSIFLLCLTASTIVGIQNKIKEGKYIGQDVESKHTIVVSETGEVYTRPDLALISFSVSIEKENIAEAMLENTEKMNSVIEYMKGQNIEEKDLKTTNFVIYPRYEYRQSQSYPYIPTGERVLAGYVVEQTLEVKIRDLEKIGGIIQGANEKGANQTGNLQFTIDNQKELKKEARAEAIEKAKEKAKELASQLGVKLVKITSFSESGVFPRPLYLETTKSGLGGADESFQIESGENKVEVTVSITYEID